MIVVEELVAGHVRDIDIGPAVVIVVADGHAHPVALAGDAGFFGDIGEGAVAIVVEEAVPVFRRVLLERRNRRAVDEVDVQVAVVVVIEQRHAGHHGFGLILVRSGTAVGDEVESGLAPRFLRIESGPRRTPPARSTHRGNQNPIFIPGLSLSGGQRARSDGRPCGT